MPPSGINAPAPPAFRNCSQVMLAFLSSVSYHGLVRSHPHRWVGTDIPTTTGPSVREIGGPTPTARARRSSPIPQQRDVALPLGNRLLMHPNRCGKKATIACVPMDTPSIPPGTTGVIRVRFSLCTETPCGSSRITKFSGDGASEVAAPPLAPSIFLRGVFTKSQTVQLLAVPRAFPYCRESLQVLAWCYDTVPHMRDGHLQSLSQPLQSTSCAL